MRVTYPVADVVSVWIGSFATEADFDLCVDGPITEALGLKTPLAAVCEVSVEDAELPVRKLLEGFSGWESFIDEAEHAATERAIKAANAALVCYCVQCEDAPQVWDKMHFLGTFAGASVSSHRPSGRGSQSHGDEPALYSCSRLGKIEEVKRLLRAGEPVNSPNDVGHTPLMVACTTENYELAALLIDAGASVSATTPANGFTALHWTVMHPPDNEAAMGQIVRLLARRKSDVNARALDGTTPLMAAAWFGGERVVATLLELGADRALRNQKGMDACHLAIARGHKKVAGHLAR